MIVAPIFLTTALSFGTPGMTTCPQPQRPPSLNVDVDVTMPTVDHNTSRNDLKNFQIATVSPYGNATNVHVNGLMRGAIKLETKLALAWQRTTDNTVNCTWYDHIDVKLTLKPTIFIAREIPFDSCLYREVLTHEYKHYQTDVNVAKDYQGIFQDELEQFLKRSSIIGPYASDRDQNVKKDLMVRLDNEIQVVNDRMKSERIKRQAVIDTRSEYERVAHACGDAAGMM